MKKSGKNFILFILLATFFAACRPSLDLNNSGWIQKRKYIKGYYVPLFSCKHKLIESNNKQKSPGTENLNQTETNPEIKKENKIILIPQKSSNLLSYNPDKNLVKTAVSKKVKNIMPSALPKIQSNPKDTIIKNYGKSNPVSTTKINPLALTSFIMAVLGVSPLVVPSYFVMLEISTYANFLMLLLIPALILGLISKHQIKKHPEKGNGRKYSNAAIIISVSVISLLLLLVIYFSFFFI